MKIIITVLFSVLLVLTLFGCSNETGGPEIEDFAVTFVVSDDQGAPVAGLRAGLSPALPESLVTIHPRRAAKDLPDPQGLLTRNIRDVAGRLIRTGTDTLVGVPFAWDGRDQDGDLVHDGWYEFEYLLYDLDDGSLLSARVEPSLFYTGADPDHYLAGTTDAEGAFTVTDRTFVPAFYDPAQPFHQTLEDTIAFALTPETWVRLRASDGVEMWHTFVAVDGPQTVAITWAPEP